MIIKATNIRKSFGEVEVLKGIDFEAEKGEIVAIVGASGAGKSTLLQILGTLSTPDGGSLIIEDRTIFAGGDSSARNLGRKFSDSELARFRGRRIGFVFQQHHLLPEFTTVENVMIPALIAGSGKQEAELKARDLLFKVGLSHREGHKPSQLSGGEQQRVALARALINNPPILLADEPTGNLDPKTSWEIMKLIEEINEKGTTVLLVTHNREIVNERKKRVITMKHGVIISDEEQGAYIDED